MQYRDCNRSWNWSTQSTCILSGGGVWNKLIFAAWTVSCFNKGKQPNQLKFFIFYFVKVNIINPNYTHFTMYVLFPYNSKFFFKYEILFPNALFKIIWIHRWWHFPLSRIWITLQILWKIEQTTFKTPTTNTFITKIFTNLT